MAFIVEQYTGDKGIQLGCENLIRAMPWGANWNKIRVGCRVATNGYGSISMPSTSLPPSPVLGFSQGAKGHLSNDCVDTCYSSTISVQSGIYTGTPPAAYYFVNGGTINVGFFQRVGSTSTMQGYSGGQICYSAVPTALRSLWYFQVEKSATTQLSVSIFMPNSTQVLINSTRGDFLKGLENEGTPANTSVVGFATGALTPSTRAFDHAFIGWSHAIPTTCFYDFSVIRFY